MRLLMFTGLVELMATIVEVNAAPPGRRIVVAAPDFAGSVAIGDSIAVNGCCLTVIEVRDANLAFDAGPETLERTNLGQLVAGSSVNLERSLRVGDRLGGHFVTGHTDGVATLTERVETPGETRMTFRTDAALTQMMILKGSLAVDGVSLTLTDVSEGSFSVALIPHTLAMTTLGSLTVGDAVNLETDLVAKYVGRWLECRS